MENKLSLYQLNSEMMIVANMLDESYDEETGTYDENLVNKFKELKVQRENKLNACVYVIKTTENNIELIDKEIARLKELKKKQEKTDIKVRELLAGNLEVGKKYDFGLHKISWRKSSSTNIDKVPEIEDKTSYEKIDDCYYKVTTSYEASKSKNKEAIENGEKIKYAFIEEKTNMQIK